MRILHVPLNIANQPGYIARAQRRLGHDVQVWEFGDNAFGFTNDRRIDIYARSPDLIWDAFVDAVPRFDVFHFNFARSFFSYPWPVGRVPPYWDLPLLRTLGKKVFFTFHGTDCRTRRVLDENNPWSFYRYSDITVDDERVERNVNIIRTYANKMFITSPEYTMFVPDAMLQPRTLDLEEWPEQQAAQREIPKILHVPSARGTKGTSFVIDGMRLLEKDGVKFEFTLLEGVPHDQAKRAIGDADIVIDNVLTGDYEVVSIETMSCNRVPVAYRQERSKAAFPEAPVYELDPSTFVDRMRTLIEDLPLRRELAARGRTFVAAHHDAPVVAKRLLDVYEAEQPPVLASTYPDWAHYGGVEALHKLEQQLARSEAQRLRAIERAHLLAGRLGVDAGSFGPDPLRPPIGKRLLQRIPGRLRRPLRGGAGRLERWVRSDPKRVERARAILRRARFLKARIARRRYDSRDLR